MTWITWTHAEADARPELADAIRGFTAPASAAGDTATEWLRESALAASPGVVTRLLVRDDGSISGFYSHRFGEVELRSDHRRALDQTHPTQGAFLVTWLAKAVDQPRRAGEELVLHAIATGRRLAAEGGAVVIALDPYDTDVDRYWRNRWGFRSSRTRLDNGLKRLWLPLESA